ncbi:hypothetical protein [Arundinibacter roseus]|uniref:Glycosyltransferase RgtA/B/C/D-like domain-containing protein n=1 Tax=Arundinibacter roseus TaxID=2070510 RepID=A0A4V2X9F1_9BACT|nr:hypothetical protein [Arundinibacter roseus]TDB63475.1 hypothetical protein EZE20_17095 [Arundinibacter roseus]
MSSFIASQRNVLMYVVAIFLLAGAIYASFFFWRSQRMSTNWMGPFLSAAQHLQPGERTFLIDLEDVLRFKSLDNVVQEDAYHFAQSTNTQPYIYDPIGYPYLIKAATLLFPWAGNQLAIILLQCLVHSLLCICVFTAPGLPMGFRMLFFGFYALNPLILRFVIFNHYYFWQAIPSFWLLFGALGIRAKFGWAVLFLTLPLVLLARPTTLFICLFCLLVLYRFGPKARALGYTIFFITTVTFLYVPNQKNPWHTMYVGIGGYSNPTGIKLSDESGYALFEENTGKLLNASTGGNYFEPKVQNTYHMLTRQAYLSAWKQHPFLLIKNSVVYFFGAFSLGYINKAPDWLNYFLAATGFLYFVFLLYKRKYWLLAASTITVIGFAPYYPPIQAYMYGNYLLLIWALIEVILPFFPKSWSDTNPADS